MRKGININQTVMKAEDIAQLNQAVFVLRHFVDLSSKILPFLQGINKMEDPTVSDLADKAKIIDVFNQFEFDTDTSQMLMGSPILEHIKVSYEKLILQEDAKIEMKAFKQEYVKLIRNWNRMDMN